MKEFLKVLGAIIVLIGVLFLMVYYFGFQKNILLVLGGLSMFVGFMTHVFINKFIKDKE